MAILILLVDFVHDTKISIFYTLIYADLAPQNLVASFGNLFENCQVIRFNRTMKFKVAPLK